MPNNDILWRAMYADDLPEVNRIAAVVHPDYPESPAVFAERLDLFADGCWVAGDGAGQLHGYAITHPALLGQPPALDSLLQALPAAADCLYLHDVALLASARSAGLGTALLGLMRQCAQARTIGALALVAVNNSAPYWRGRGFHDYPHADAALAHKIASYDADAQYLVLTAVLA